MSLEGLLKSIGIIKRTDEELLELGAKRYVRANFSTTYHMFEKNILKTAKYFNKLSNREEKLSELADSLFIHSYEKVQRYAAVEADRIVLKRLTADRKEPKYIAGEDLWRQTGVVKEYNSIYMLYTESFLNLLVTIYGYIGGEREKESLIRVAEQAEYIATQVGGEWLETFTQYAADLFRRIGCMDEVKRIMDSARGEFHEFLQYRYAEDMPKAQNFSS